MPTTDTAKLVEMARGCGAQFGADLRLSFGNAGQLSAFKAAIVASLCGDVEPVGYLAWRDGKPDWSEDCVCEDAVYPVDDEDRTSMAIYPASTVAALKAERDALLAALRTADRTFAENGILASHAARQEIQAALTKGQP